MNNFHTRFMARLLGTCFISTTAGGPVVAGPGMLVAQGGEVVQVNATATAEMAADPDAPVVQPTAEEVAAEETRRAALTDEERTAEDAAKAAAAEKPAEEEVPKVEPTAWDKRDKTKDVALDATQTAEIEGMSHLSDTQKAAIKDFTVETNTTGTLSEASRIKAAEIWGVDRKMVDHYVAGIEAANARAKAANAAPAVGELTPAQKAAFDLRMEALYGASGGKESWEQFSAWATGGGLTEEQQTELAMAIDTSPNLGVMAAKAHMETWKAQGNGGAPRDLSRGGAKDNTPLPSEVKGYATQSDQQAALNARDSMGRMKMDSDPTYRQQVETKMAVSDFSKAQLNESFLSGTRPMM